MVKVITNAQGKVYTANGKALISSAVVTSLNVTPSTSAQTITAPSGTDGYSPVNVDAVTAAIDSNITAGNIKKDVQILGVTGTYTDLGIPREIVNNTYQMPSSNFNYVLPPEAKDLGIYALFSAFYGCTGIVSANLDALETCNTTSAMQSCFILCSNLVTASFGSLRQIYGSNALNTAFAYATKIANIYFNALTTSSFSTTKSQFSQMMQGTGSTVIHTIHFPSNLESTIQTLTGYPNFGGTNGYVILAFDLPATS